MRFRKRSPVLSCRIATLAGAAGIVIALSIAASDARAFPTYSGWWLGECTQCHGDFRASTYLPPSRDQAWPDQFGAGALHGTHWGMVGFDCAACHMDGSRYPVSMTESSSSTFPCHADSEPSQGFHPVGENVKPPNYFFLDIEPCNRAPDFREDFAGSGLGLDNDGDDRYDEADPDCAVKGSPTCGLGPELGLVLMPLLRLRRRRYGDSRPMEGRVHGGE
jgi:hypothetical protein